MFDLFSKFLSKGSTEFNGKLSVIIPCFNSEKYLDRCLKSIIAQTYKNIEVICVDDKSQDSTLDMLKGYSQVDSRIKVVQKDKNQGSGHSRNIAISIAQGDVLTFVDSDDYLLDNNFYKECLDEFEKRKVDCLITPYLREKGQSISQDKIFSKRKINSNQAVNLYLARKFGTHASCGKLFDKKLFKMARYVEVGYSQDVLFMAQALDAAETVSVFNRPGYVYYTDNFSATRPNVISDFHIFSSFRLLAEVLLFQKQKNLSGDKIDLKDFLKLWNKDHGKRLNKYVNDHDVLSHDLQVMSSVLWPINNLLNEVVVDQNIVKHFLSHVRELGEEDFQNLSPSFLRGLNYLSKVVDELKK